MQDLAQCQPCGPGILVNTSSLGRSIASAAREYKLCAPSTLIKAGRRLNYIATTSMTSTCATASKRPVFLICDCGHFGQLHELLGSAACT